MNNPPDIELKTKRLKELKNNIWEDNQTDIDLKNVDIAVMLESNRLAVISRRQMQDYESNILNHLNPISQQRESLTHESMRKEFNNSTNLEKDVEIMVINTMKEFGIDIEEEDDDKDDDETVDYKLIPELRTLEWDDSSDSDIEHTIYPNISNSIVGEIGNQYNIDLSDIDFSSLGVDDIDNIIINATQMNAKDMENFIQDLLMHR